MKVRVDAVVVGEETKSIKFTVLDDQENAIGDGVINVAKDATDEEIKTKITEAAKKIVEQHEEAKRIKESIGEIEI